MYTALIMVTSMNEFVDESGDINLLIDNMAELALPRLLDIRKKVGMGGELGEADIRFMSQVTRYAQQRKQLIDQFPEWQKFFAELLHLHGEIVIMALDNIEKRNTG